MVLILGICFFIVEIKSYGKVYSDVAEIPYNRVALVLGTNPIGPSGGINYYFKYRIDACEVLYKANKVSIFLVSGDNHSKDYDEPQAMKDALVERGIPESSIVMDYAGLRTLDSVIRSQKVFGQNSVTIVSQSFHNKRAVCLAQYNDIEAVAYNAKDIKRSKTYVIYGIGRESLARFKMFHDVLTKKQPKFLGKEIEI